MICVDYNGSDHFELFYRHCDGYPTGLGRELIEAMLKHGQIEEVLSQVSAEPEGRSVQRIEDVFLEVQSDLEWIYVICNANDPGTVSLQIFKTSNPYTRRQFIWPVWFSYRVHMKKNKALKDMPLVELVASNVLEALGGFEKAGPLRGGVVPPPP
jgi:hypothetical protein